MTTPIEVDGAMGEGGGQVLRSALSLSLLTGQPFRLSRIRANRDRAGLRPQHLTAVRAAARVAGAEVRGDRVGSEEIDFAPGPVWSGDYFFDIGTAGATSLVLQTLLLPLALAPGTSSVAIRGGTHVPWSPCFHYLDWHWRPFLARIGVPFDLTMAMAGFYPQGGGELQAQIPGGSRPMPVRLIERGPLRAVRGLSAVANLPREIAERQRRQALRRLRNPLPKVESQVVVEELPAASRGTVLLLLADCAPGRACCFALGAPGKRAERVADEVVDALAALVATVKTAIARGARYLRVHTDCPALVHLWQVRRGDDAMSEVRQAARPLRRLQLRLGPRRFNQVANALARDGVRTPQKGTGHAEHQPEVHPKAGNDPK